MGSRFSKREARYAITTKVKDYKSQTVLEAFEDIFSNQTNVFQSVTFDNGSEFSKVSDLETDKRDIYFCHAYSSWERGSNENYNGILREYIPKGKSLHNYAKSYIHESTEKINNRKRAILNGQSAQEVFEKEIEQLKAS